MISESGQTTTLDYSSRRGDAVHCGEFGHSLQREAVTSGFEPVLDSMTRLCPRRRRGFSNSIDEGFAGHAFVPDAGTVLIMTFSHAVWKRPDADRARPPIGYSSNTIDALLRGSVNRHDVSSGYRVIGNNERDLITCVVSRWLTVSNRADCCSLGVVTHRVTLVPEALVRDYRDSFAFGAATRNTV